MNKTMSGECAMSLSVFTALTWLLCLVSPLGGERVDCNQMNSIPEFVRACRCYFVQPGTESDMWVGCQGRGMPDIMDAFHRLPHRNDTQFDRLWLWDNTIPVIPPQFFGQITARKVIIESSNLGQFADAAFSGLNPALTTLELRNNAIEKLDPKIFQGLTNLQHLDFSGNKINHIKAELFEHLQGENLEFLSFYRNEIFDIEPGSFKKLKNLKRLDLGENNLIDIQDGVFDGLDNLEQLHLTGNRLIRIREHVFDDLPKLQVLHIGTNNISQLSLRGLPELTKLYINNNQIQNLDQLRLTGLKSLVNLNLDRNRIETIRGENSFGSFPNLRVLSLTHNQITNISPHALDHLTSIQTLSLQHNKLEVIDGPLFSKMTQLRNLFVQQNLITNIAQDNLEGLVNLKILSLAHNEMEEIHPDAFAGLQSLSKLFVNDNKLQSLSNRSLDLIRGHVQNIDISDNPWICDCSILWMSRWQMEGRLDLSSSSNAQCSPPHSPSQPLLGTLSQLSSICSFGSTSKEDNSWITALGIVLAALSLMVLGAIVMLYVKDHHSVRRVYALQRVPSDMKLLVRPSESMTG